MRAVLVVAVAVDNELDTIAGLTGLQVLRGCPHVAAAVLDLLGDGILRDGIT